MSQSEPQGPYGELAESGVATVALAEIELAQVRGSGAAGVTFDVLNLKFHRAKQSQ